MLVRRLEAEDAEPFWRLRLKALKEHPDAFGASYEEAESTPIEAVRERFANTAANFILGAFEEPDELVGTVGFRQEPMRKMRHKGTIWGMYVERSRHGNGIGRLLLERLLAEIRKVPDIEQAHLLVVESNVRAKRLYESMGFVSFGIERNAMKLDDGVYVDECFMVRRIERQL